MKRRKSLRIVIYLLFIIIIIVAGVQLSFTFYIDKNIAKHLKSEVARQTNGVYEMQIGKLTTNIFDQSIYLKGFVLKSVKEPESASPKFFASASEINLSDFSLFSFLFKKDLIISKMELVNPSGYIFRNKTLGHDQLKHTSKKFSFYSLIQKYIHSLQIKSIEISDADIQIYNDISDTDPFIGSKKNGLNISNLQINKSIDETGKLFLADSMNLVLNNIAYKTSDSLYSISIKQLHASYIDSQLTMDSFEVAPNYSKKEFANKAGKQTDRFHISATRLNFSHMDVKSFFESNWFIANTLKIDSLNISAYRNKNDIRSPVKAKSVQQLLTSIPIYTVIDSIQVQNAKITYEEVAEGASKAGIVYFNDLDAVITGITSDTSLFSKYASLQLNASTKFMNEGKLTVHYTFPLNTEKMVFDCSGKMTDIPMPAINPILEPNAKISIKGGQIDSMIFSFHANEFGSKGKLKLIYHQLKIEFINKEKKAGIIRELFSFLTHQLVIKEDNPAKEKPVRQTEINYKRDPTRFIFNYSWKSLLSGIKPTIGIPDNKK